MNCGRTIYACISKCCFKKIYIPGIPDFGVLIGRTKLFYVFKFLMKILCWEILYQLFSVCSEEELVEESGEEEEEENENLCAVCSTGGMLVCCDTCPLVYHLDCAVPPLKKVPRGKWQCQLCTGVTTKGKIKLPRGKKTISKSPYLSGTGFKPFCCFQGLR